MGEVYRDMPAELAQGGVILTEPTRRQLVALANASKCHPPLTAAELAALFDTHGTSDDA